MVGFINIVVFVRCSGVALSSRWVVTAAHCVCGGTRARARRAQAVHAPRAVPLAALYPHPHFSYRAASVWAVSTVRALAHDVGLAETREPLERRPPELSPHRFSAIAPPDRYFYALGYHTLTDLVGKKLVVSCLHIHNYVCSLITYLNYLSMFMY